MFNIDTGADGGGSKGPWISFKPKGSAKYGLPYKSWQIRTKTDNGSARERFTAIETQGVVLDIYAKGGELCGSLKLGWANSDGESSKAPDRRWWPSVMRSEKRPSEEKTAEGGYVWRNAMSIRAAIDRNNAVTWEDEGWGGYKGFSALIKEINAGFGANEGLCPFVKCTGYKDEGSGKSATSVPLFQIIKWVPRPDCLKEDAPVIAAEPAPTPAPAPQPAATASLDNDPPF